MKNLKLQIVSLITLVGIAGSPLVSLAHGVSQAKAQEGPKDGLKQELQELKASREAFKEARTTEAKERSEAARAKAASAKQSAEAKRAEAEKRKEAHRKEVLLRLIDVQIKHFENVLRRVFVMPHVLEADKNKLKVEIDKVIAYLNELKTKVQNAQTAEELKTLAAQIKDNLKAKQEIVQKIVNVILSSRLNEAVRKAEERVKEAETKIIELKAEGKDVTELEKLLGTAKEKLAAAKSELTKQSIKAAQEALRGLYKALKELAEELED